MLTTDEANATVSVAFSVKRGARNILNSGGNGQGLKLGLPYVCIFNRLKCH